MRDRPHYLLIDVLSQRLIPDHHRNRFRAIALLRVKPGLHPVCMNGSLFPKEISTNDNFVGRWLCTWSPEDKSSFHTATPQILRQYHRPDDSVGSRASLQTPASSVTNHHT